VSLLILFANQDLWSIVDEASDGAWTDAPTAHNGWSLVPQADDDDWGDA